MPGARDYNTYICIYIYIVWMDGDSAHGYRWPAHASHFEEQDASENEGELEKQIHRLPKPPPNSRACPELPKAVVQIVPGSIYAYTVIVLYS